MIVADNTQQMITEDAPAGRTEDFNYQRDLPCLAAPFPQFWVEARSPAGALMGGNRAWGALITAHDFQAEGAQEEFASFVEKPGARWMLLATMVYDRGDQGVMAGRLVDGPRRRRTPHRPALLAGVSLQHR